MVAEVGGTAAWCPSTGPAASASPATPRCTCHYAPIALTAAHPLLHAQGQGTSYSFTGHAALHWAAAKGQAQCLRWLLGRGAAVDQANAAGGTALHAAVANAQVRGASSALRF